MDNELLTRRQAAELFHVQMHTIYKWEKAGKIARSITVNRKPRYTLKELAKIAEPKKTMNNGN